MRGAAERTHVAEVAAGHDGHLGGDGVLGVRREGSEPPPGEKGEEGEGLAGGGGVRLASVEDLGKEGLADLGDRLDEGATPTTGRQR